MLHILYVYRTFAPDSATAVTLADKLMPTADASIFKKFSQRTLKEKLSNVPVFMITNGRNNLYLSPSAGTGQAAVIFTSYEDAKDMQFEMLQNPAYRGQVQIMVMTLEDAYDRVKGSLAEVEAAEMSNKDVPDNTLLYYFHEAVNVQEKMDSFYIKNTARAGIPLFYADGLVIEKDSTNVRPLFFDPQVCKIQKMYLHTNS
jgi:Tic22-like family